LSSDDDVWAAGGDEGERLLAIAREAAGRASAYIRTHVPGRLTLKGDRDIASETDTAVERYVQEFLRVRTPKASFLGEEQGSCPNESKLLWILDPVDGTINLLHGVPLCAVSLSVARYGVVLAAVIDLPFLETQYTAVRGAGSFANGRRLQVSSTAALDAALVSIDQFTFGEDAARKNPARLRLVEHLALRAQRIRMFGTSAIDLAWTAEGRLDACIMLGNKQWDTSAGVLLAREAGARVLDHTGSDHTWDSASTVVVAPALEAEFMSVVTNALGDVI
jgi:myo-inositol-1(or 4)-monophosphatase